MQKLRVNLRNCYGIKKLNTEFDFSGCSVFAIYAPNGAMKSSLAQTFKDVADGVPSKDRIFPKRASVREILDENGAEIPREAVVVIRPYDEVYGHTEKTSTLLLDGGLRKEYEKLHAGIDDSKALFLKSMKEVSGSKKDLEAEISSTFTKSNDQFFLALGRVKAEVLAQKDAPFANIKYDRIFDEKVLAFLNTGDVRSAIKDYIEKYNQLLAGSTYFKKGTFNYYNASTIAKSLADNGFFNAKHTVRLNANEVLEIATEKQLADLIKREQESISGDAGLRKKFSEIEKQINKNANLRDFHGYLLENERILPELANVEKFREDLWKSYFKERQEFFLDLVGKYEDAEKRKQEIEQAASDQRSQWESIRLKSSMPLDNVNT